MPWHGRHLRQDRAAGRRPDGGLPPGGLRAAARRRQGAERRPQDRSRPEAAAPRAGQNGCAAHVLPALGAGQAATGLEKAAQAVLDARASFPDSSLADLYDPNTMPPALVKAHQQLDKAVDLCYRSQPFTSEAKRIEFLFELYDKYTAGMFVQEKKKSKKK